jgi:AcrR family transcriptional regulator
MKIRVARKPANAYQHGNLREALVQAGLKLLGESGVEGLSLRAAAQLAGVSHAAPYRHFKDKNDLVAAVAEQGFRLLTASMREEAARVGGGSFRERVRALGRGYVKFARAHPAYLRVIFGGVLSRDLCPPDLQAAGSEAYHVLRDAVAEGIARGDERAADPDVVSLAAWSMAHGLSHLLINQAVPPAPGGGAPPGADAVATDALVDAVLGLLGTGINVQNR